MNFMRNSRSTAEISVMCSRLSQSSMSSAVVFGVTRMLSSSKTSWNTRLSLVKISLVSMLCKSFLCLLVSFICMLSVRFVAGDFNHMVFRHIAGDSHLPDGIAAFILADFFKAEGSEQFAHHVILRGGIVIPPDRLDAGLAAALHKTVQHGELHIALQDTAAHQPKLYIECAAVLFADGNGYNAVVAEFVDQLAVKADILITLEGFLHFGRRVALRRHVELVALVGELGNPGQIHR